MTNPTNQASGESDEPLWKVAYDAFGEAFSKNESVRGACQCVADRIAAALATKPAAPAEPDWWFAACDDPDYSCLYDNKADAFAQISDHGGGTVTPLYEAQPAANAEVVAHVNLTLWRTCEMEAQDCFSDKPFEGSVPVYLAPPAQAPAAPSVGEPVAWMMKWPNHLPSFTTDKSDYVTWLHGRASYPDELIPLYATPPAAPAATALPWHLPANVWTESERAALAAPATAPAVGASPEPASVVRDRSEYLLGYTEGWNAAREVPVDVAGDDMQINGEPATAHSILAALVDIHDDREASDPEHRCYIPSAWGEVLDMARKFLATPAPAVGASVQPVLASDPVALEFDDYPDFHDEAMGCGLEDRGIRDRYEAMRYGWDQALERVGERIDGFLENLKGDK